MKRLALLLALVPIAARGADIRIVNVDPAGAGLNDPRPVNPVGGNPGTTLGEQRLNLLKEAARIWSELLPDGPPVLVRATFRSLPCNAFGAVLGAAGPTTASADFAGAPFAGTWYPAPLANQLAGSDQDPSTEEIEAYFNADLGTACAFPRGFYYGFDTNHGASISLLHVVLHELGHGLGFISLTDQDGAFEQGLPAVFDRFVFDDAARAGWTEMATDAERAASQRNDGALVFTGTRTAAFGRGYLTARTAFRASAPGADPMELRFGAAFYGATLPRSSVEAPFAFAESASGDACSPPTNAAALAGKAAVARRGPCSYGQQASLLQAAGVAIAVLTDESGGNGNIPGNETGITIPVVQISNADGERIRASLPLTAYLGTDSAARSGTDAWGRLRLYAPATYQPGSSVSHFDTSASPNLLMEPSATNDLPIGVDATLPLLSDLGWPARSEPAATWILPSAARAPGRNGAFWTTDLSIANGGGSDAAVTLTFLGHDADGRAGAQITRTVPAGRSLALPDLLSLFGVTEGYGAVRVTSSAAGLSLVSQTATGAPGGGTYGQALPAFGEGALVTLFDARAIAGVRDGGGFRTNLVLANATEESAKAEVALFASSGALLGAAAYDLAPLAMTQVSGVAAALGAAQTGDAVLVVSTPGGTARIAAYASLIDDATNDPRTLVPERRDGSFILPSSAHAPGKNGAFYTTDLTIANRGGEAATVTLQFLGHERDGRAGATAVRTVAARATTTIPDVLGTLFGVGAEGDYGAIRITSSAPTLAVSSRTATPTPGGAGTFGQALAAQTARDFAAPGAPRTLQPLREDAAFRTNVVLVNAAETPAHVDVTLRAATGETLGTAGLDLGPLEMRQIGNAVTALGAPSGTAGAALVVSPTTPGARVACTASVIDNVTNDPRTLVP